MARSLSLLDDAGFLAELDRSDVPALFKPMPTGEPHWIYEPDGGPPPLTRWLVALRVAFFTVLAGLGATIAALLFQEQVELLLR